jgi:DNA transposition AAA+ family ATPase
MPERSNFDRLMDEQRILGESRTVRDDQEITHEVGERVLATLAAFMRRTGIKHHQIARNLGIAPLTLSQVQAWKYKGRWPEIIGDIERWIEVQIKREAAPKLSEFVMTRVAEEIMTVATLVVDARDDSDGGNPGGIGSVFGPSGIGKTLALRAVAEEKPGSIYVCINSAIATPRGMLEAISHAVRPSGYYSGHITTLLNTIVNALRGTSRLLIIDEVHMLCYQKDDRPFQILRQIHDETKSPQLWCSTINMKRYFRRGEGKGRQPLSQVRSRLGIERDLTQRTRAGGNDGEPLFSVEEVRSIFRKCKMRLTPEAGRYLSQLANLPDSGGLRAARSLMLLTLRMFQKSEAAVTVEMLREAQQFLCQGDEYEMLTAMMEGEGTGLRKVG